MIAFAHRNLKIFFRDRSAVFFSLLSPLILIGLYVLFLGDVYADNFSEIANARELLDRWVMAGLLSTTAVTGAIGLSGGKWMIVPAKSKRTCSLLRFRAPSLRRIPS